MTLRKIHRTNADGTCLYCGQKIRPTKYERERGDPADSWGPMSDGRFCTLKCASRFGRAAAANGFRLADYVEQ